MSMEVVSQHNLPLEGPEGTRHSHAYRVQVEVTGPHLDDRGFLVNLSLMEKLLDEVLSRFRDRSLNDMSEFSGRVPTLENFCRVIWESMSALLRTEGLEEMTVTIWESPVASASYRQGFRP